MLVPKQNIHTTQLHQVAYSLSSCEISESPLCQVLILSYYSKCIVNSILSMKIFLFLQGMVSFFLNLDCPLYKLLVWHYLTLFNILTFRSFSDPHKFMRWGHETHSSLNPLQCLEECAIDIMYASNIWSSWPNWLASLTYAGAEKINKERAVAWFSLWLSFSNYCQFSFANRWTGNGLIRLILKIWTWL